MKPDRSGNLVDAAAARYWLDYDINRWKAALTWKQTGERLHFDGIYQAFLNKNNLCTCFNEWRHADPPLPEDNAPE